MESKEDDEAKDGESSPAKGKKTQQRRMYGLGAARVVQDFVQAGTPLVRIGPLIKRVVLETVRVKLDGKTGFFRTQSKTLALGISHLDKAKLIKSILAAPYLLIAGNESLRKGDEKFPFLLGSGTARPRRRGGDCFESAHERQDSFNPSPAFLRQHRQCSRLSSTSSDVCSSRQYCFCFWRERRVCDAAAKDDEEG